MAAITGTSSDDILNGTPEDDQIMGLEGNDRLFGEDGNDRLSGGLGDDHIEGGAGDDMLSPSFFGSPDSEAGFDLLDGGPGSDSISYFFTRVGVNVNLLTGIGSGGAEGDRYISVENVEATAQHDVIIGNDADNVIDGRFGDDHIEAGGGDDTIHVYDQADIDGGAGVDHLEMNVSGTLDWTMDTTTEGAHFQNIEQFTLYGADTDDVFRTGDYSDLLYGNFGDDILSGGGGDDEIHGGNGNDVIEGGMGADILYGNEFAWTYDDTAVYAHSAAGVTVDLVSGRGFGGDAEGDTLFFFHNVVGSAHGDTLIGTTLDDRLDGGAGDDHLISGGNSGRDSDFQNGGDLLRGGAGADILEASAGSENEPTRATYDTSSAGVTVNLANGRGTGGDAQGDTLIRIKDVEGSAHDDTLLGSSSRDFLNGAAGADHVEGGGGHDSLHGGAGGDVIAGGEGNDWLVGGEGSDTFIYDMEAGSRDRIVDFQAGDGGDIIGLTKAAQDWAGIHSFGDLVAHADDTPDGLYIDLGDGRPWTYGILMENTHVADLSADNLHLM